MYATNHIELFIIVMQLNSSLSALNYFLLNLYKNLFILEVFFRQLA